MFLKAAHTVSFCPRISSCFSNTHTPGVRGNCSLQQGALFTLIWLKLLHYDSSKPESSVLSPLCYLRWYNLYSSKYYQTHPANRFLATHSGFKVTEAGLMLQLLGDEDETPGTAHYCSINFPWLGKIILHLY